MTQLKHAWQPELLRFLAIELDPINRATSRKTFRCDLQYFQNLDQVVFVVDRPDEKIIELVRQLSDEPRWMNREVENLRHIGRVISPSGWMVGPTGFTGLVRGSRLKKCKLAVRRGTRFDFVDLT